MLVLHSQFFLHSDFLMGPIAVPTLKASSRNASVAVGKYDRVSLVWTSLSRPLTLRGPKSSSGVVNRFSCLLKVKTASSLASVPPLLSSTSKMQSDSKDLPGKIQRPQRCSQQTESLMGGIKSNRGALTDP